MDHKAFQKWIEEMGFTQEQAAKALDVDRSTVQNYSKGQRRDGKPAAIPRVVALACLALFHRLDRHL